MSLSPAMHAQRKTDAFSITFYDQGLRPPPPVPTQTALPPITCPYHVHVLQPQSVLNVPSGVHPTQRLEYTPISGLPVGLSQNCRVGTSASAGCTCIHNPRVDVRGFTGDVDAAIRNQNSSEGDGTARQH